jgi:CRP/FNR family transcriptional regulator
MPEQLRLTFERLKTSVPYAKGDTAFHEGDPCHSVFVVCEGTMKLSTASNEGKVLLLGFSTPGEILGASEVVSGCDAYESSAVAAEPSVLGVIPREHFTRFIASYPQATCCLTRALAEQYRAAQREAKFLAFGETSTARLARLLLEWSADRGRVAVDGTHIVSHATHTDLAQSIGSTRETVTRILGVLNHKGVIERHPDEIVIRSAEELTRLAAY